MKQDVELVCISLNNLSLDDSKDVKRIISLLETLSSTLISIKSSCNSKNLFDFSEQIVYFDSLIHNTVILLKTGDNKTQNDHYILLHLLAKNYRNLLKITNNQEHEAYPKLLENLLDYLIRIKEVWCSFDSEAENYHLAHLENIALLLIKCIYFISANFNISFNELERNDVCGKFVGIIRCFLFYGLENYKLNSLALNLFPCPISQMFSTDPTDANPKKKRGKHDDELLADDSVFNTSNISLSASEYSSSELDEEILRDVLARRLQHNKKIFAKIRTLSYECLQSALSLFGIRTFFGFWSFLFPDTPFNSRNNSFNVLTTISRDSSNRTRTSALNFMFMFFDCGKRFIRTLVSESSTQTSQSFTPISVSITSMVKELHNFFDFLLFKETNTSVLILVYKVLSLIVSITPYNKLCTNILQPLFERNSFLLDHKVTQIKNLSLALYAKMFAPEMLQKEFRIWLTETKIGVEIIDKLFQNCFMFVDNQDYILLSIESIILLTSITKHHVLMKDLFKRSDTPNIDIVTLGNLSTDILENRRSFNNSVYQNLVSKFLHTVGMLLKHITAKDESIFSSDQERIDFTRQWFENVFNSSLFKQALIVQDTSVVQVSTQVTLVNVISLIPPEVFELIDSKNQYHIISILVSLSKAEIDPDVSSNRGDSEMQIYSKAKSIRCLSILQSFDCLSDDIGLIFDLIEICLQNFNHNKVRKSKLQKKKEIVLLELSLWALANICDGIHKNNLQFEVDFLTLENITAALLNGFDLNYIQYHTDDILVNLVRCCGSVINIILHKEANQIEIVSTKRETIVIARSTLIQLVEHLIKLLLSTKLYKLQWNICIALSHLVQMENFIDLCLANEVEEQNLLVRIYDSLYRTFITTSNHKVQSYSIYTICNICKLNHFASSLLQLWPVVVEKFIKDYHTVPVHSHQSWLEKYEFAINKLYTTLHHCGEDEALVAKGEMLKEFIASELANSVLDDHLQALICKLAKLLQ